jgi:hypothetical protein
VEALCATGIAQSMTDDGNSVTVPGIHIFTATITASAQTHPRAGQLTCEVDWEVDWMVKTFAVQQRM